MRLRAWTDVCHSRQGQAHWSGEVSLRSDTTNGTRILGEEAQHYRIRDPDKTANSERTKEAAETTQGGAQDREHVIQHVIKA